MLTGLQSFDKGRKCGEVRTIFLIKYHECVILPLTDVGLSAMLLNTGRDRRGHDRIVQT
jgi:hypothetical protein